MLARWRNPGGRRSTATGRSSTGTPASAPSSSGCSAHSTRRRAAVALPRDRAARPERAPDLELSRRHGGGSRRARVRGRGGASRGRTRRARPVASRVAGVRRGAGRAGRGARSGLEAGGAVQHRPRPDRGVDEGRSAFRSSGAIVASEIGSYKPAPGHWRAFQESTGADPGRHVHVAQSHYHDIVPARRARHPHGVDQPPGERGEPAPTRELPDLRGLADVLDELVPDEGVSGPPVACLACVGWFVVAASAEGRAPAVRPVPVPAGGAGRHVASEPGRRARNPGQLHLGRGRRRGARRRDHPVLVRAEAGHDQDERDRQGHEHQPRRWSSTEAGW